jgi:aspartate carbamoyltransferase catalytic subunit
MKHLVSSEQFDKQNLAYLFRLADQIKAQPEKYRQVLKNKIVATIFFEPSTRTKLSFGSAAIRLGGTLISAENATENSSTTKGESIEDTIRVIQGYADAIIIRHRDDNAAVKAASVAQVPIFNGGSGSKEHPTQALLDLYTILEAKKRLHKLKIAVMGDLKYGRTVHSLLKMLSLYDHLEVHALSAPALALPGEYLALLKNRQVVFKTHTRLKTIPRDVDVIYHTRIQRERLQNEGISEKEALFILNRQVLADFNPELIILHPLPRLQEIAPEVDSDPRARYFQQSLNGVYVRMALLADVLGGQSRL